MTKKQFLKDIRNILTSYNNPKYNKYLKFIASIPLTEEIQSILTTNAIPMTVAEIGIAADCTNAQAIYCLNTLINENIVTKIENNKYKIIN